VEGLCDVRGCFIEYFAGGAGPSSDNEVAFCGPVDSSNMDFLRVKGGQLSI
jgi:hypothetical protein